MQGISNNNIRAINILVDELITLIKTHTHKYDTTFSSVIKKINTDGSYTIFDNGGIERNVKCSIPNLVLKVGDIVWVKIPSGSLKDIHICGMKGK